jgi:hypothetical protein
MDERFTLGNMSPFPTLAEEFTAVLDDASKNAGLFPTAALLPEFTILTCAEAAREQSVMKHRSIFFMKINFREIENGNLSNGVSCFFASVTRKTPGCMQKKRTTGAKTRRQSGEERLKESIKMPLRQSWCLAESV